MTETPYTVAIIVDPGFGERVRDIVTRMPAWVVDTEVNRRVAEQVWADSRAAGTYHGDTLTTFRVDSTATAEQWCASILPSVAMHHDAYSHYLGYSAVEVFGAELTPDLRRSFAEYRLTEVSPLPGGFRASTIGGAAADSPNYYPEPRNPPDSPRRA